MSQVEKVRQCAAVIIRRGNEVLALRQSYGPGFWGVPGGIVDAGETPQQAAVREAREEVGLPVNLTRVIGIYTLQGGGWPDICAYIYEGECESADAVPTPDPSEIAEVVWLLPEALAQRQPLLPDVAAALQDLAAGRYGAVRPVQRELQLPPSVGETVYPLFRPRRHRIHLSRPLRLQLNPLPTF